MRVSVKKAYLPGSVEFQIDERPLVDAVAWVAVRWGTHRVVAIEDFTTEQIGEAIKSYRARDLTT